MKLSADTTHSRMGSQYWEYGRIESHFRQTQPTQEWVLNTESMGEYNRIHGRHNPLKDGFSIPREWQNRIRLLAETTHSRLGSQNREYGRVQSNSRQTQATQLWVLNTERETDPMVREVGTIFCIRRLWQRWIQSTLKWTIWCNKTS